MQSSDVLDVKKWTERFCFFSFKRDAKVCSAGSQTQFKKPRRVLVESKDMQEAQFTICMPIKVTFEYIAATS